MMNIHNHRFFRTHGILLARILTGGFFLMSGVSKALAFEGTAGWMASAGLPSPEVLLILTIILEIGGGIAIIVGKHFEHAAILLILFTLLVSAVFHHPGLWDPADPTQQLMFLKNLVIVAGLLYMVAFGTGESWKIEGKRKLDPLEQM